MKNLINMQFTIKANDGDKTGHTTATLLKHALMQTPQGGFDFATMRARNKVADLLDKTKAGDTIKLEDADFATSRKCVEDCRWGAVHPDLLKFGELFGL